MFRVGSRLRRVRGAQVAAATFLCLLLLWVPGALAQDNGPSPVANLALAETERIYIATIEHRALILTRRGFPAFAAAIRSGEPDNVAHFFADSFRGETLDSTTGNGVQGEVLALQRVSRSADGKPPATSVDGREFAKYLVELRKRFTPEVKVEAALISLSPGERDQTNGTWQGSLAFRIAGLRAGGGNGELMGTFEFQLKTVPDTDEIASAPGWIQSISVAALQDAVASRDLMAEVAKERGIDRALFHDNWHVLPGRRPVVTGGVFLADVDGDGHDDILVTDLKGLFLFRNRGDGHFDDVTEQSGLPHDLKGVLSAAFGDFDGDGMVDLILPGRVFRNIGGGRFENISSRVRIDFGSGVSGFTVGDYDRDGRLDLYVARNDGKGQHTGKNSWIDGPGGPGNQLWHNLGNWKFEEVSAKANAQAGHRSCFSAAWLDVNNDNWPDIYVINEFGGGVLLVNNGDGTFREQFLVDDAGDFGSMGMAVADFNNDGNIDIYTANMYSKAGRRIMENLREGSFPPPIFAKMKRFVTGSELYRNEGGLKFARVGKSMRVHSVGWAYGAAFFDADNDGFLDIYGTAGFASVNKEEPDG